MKIQCLKNMFTRIAGGGELFLLGSLATIESATAFISDNVLRPAMDFAMANALPSPNLEMVALGGTGLAIAAGCAIAKKFQYMPYALLPANLFLTLNGIHMIANNNPDTNLFWAGMLLASSNSVGGFGTINYHLLKNRIEPDTHGAGTVLAGGQIATAGAILGDPLLATIGGAFASDGAARAMSENRTSQPYKDLVSHIVRWKQPTPQDI